MLALGQRSPIGPVIQVAMSQETSLIWSQRSLGEQIQELLSGLAVPAGRRPHQPAGVMIDHDRDLPGALADRDLVDPDSPQAREPVATLARLGRDPFEDLTDRPPRDRISCETALFEVCTASHAT